MRVLKLECMCISGNSSSSAVAQLQKYKKGFFQAGAQLSVFVIPMTPHAVHWAAKNEVLKGEIDTMLTMRIIIQYARMQTKNWNKHGSFL